MSWCGVLLLILCSVDGGRYKLTPRMPVRVRSADIIEFGPEKQVPTLSHLGFLYTWSHVLLTIVASELVYIWNDGLANLLWVEGRLSNFISFTNKWFEKVTHKSHSFGCFMWGSSLQQVTFRVKLRKWTAVVWNQCNKGSWPKRWKFQ